MISKDKPAGFNPKFYVVGCVIEYDGKMLLLKYPESKKDNPSKWGSPAGKIDSGETAKEAVVREVFEETGLHLNPEEIIFVERAYVQYNEFDFVYDIFKYNIQTKKKPDIILKAKEHVAYKWSTVTEALKEDLVYDEDYCIKKAYNL
jgi:8-oxo-dGTP diphosphatase